MRGRASAPIDPAAELARLESERAAAEAALAGMAATRPQVVLDGSPEAVLDLDRRRALEAAKIEQVDARLAVVRQATQENDAKAAHAVRLRAYEDAKTARADGVKALAEIRRCIDMMMPARARLAAAKAAVAQANRFLPVDFARLVDPEGEHVGGGAAASILDTRFIGGPAG